MYFHRGSICKVNCGGYSSGVTPLPIPNRAVKPVCADGSALPGVRVGCCRALRYRRISMMFFGIFRFTPGSRSEPPRWGAGDRIPLTPCVASLPDFLSGFFFIFSRPRSLLLASDKRYSPEYFSQRATSRGQSHNVIPDPIGNLPPVPENGSL